MKHYFLHIDLDAFFASVEQLDNPEYRGKPVIVGGKPDSRRSVVSTCSYEARAFGVHSAMSIAQAYHLCPHAIFLDGRMERYHEKSSEVMEIFKEFSPDVMQISIDEAFIDLTGTERLFGLPEETAKRIKQLVKERTGLTVSMGLASNHYIAKIASGMNKPDGFLVVNEGEEEKFMLSLPLEKLWGAGGKTLEKLHKNGMFTMADIHSRSLELLKKTFGEASGSFLYNAVRGREDSSFTTEAKSHSVSAETTYDFDLENEDAIEKAILILVQTVHFRMLSEKIVSKTPFIKIRYDDFQTVTAQETSERNIRSVEDFFERIKRIFHRKYEKGRGIRLLGIGAMNTESASLPQETELFDFGDERKKKVEEAILKATKKTSIEIKKARLLGFVLALWLFTGAGPCGKIAAESEKKVSSDGAGALVFDTTKTPLKPLDDDSLKSIFYKEFGKEKNSNIEFLANGRWKASLESGFATTFGFSNDTNFSFTIPIFKQQADLSLWLFLNKKFYFEATFADDFEKNTIATGYYGDGFLKHARISNRKISFPEFYSVNKMGYGLGGGDSLTPGIMASWENEKIKIDAVLRYENLVSKSKSWQGRAAINENTSALASWNRAQQFFIPSITAAKNIKNVYVENSNGDYKDEAGISYKKLSSNEFLSSFMENGGILTLGKDNRAVTASGKILKVAVSFFNGTEELKNKIGNFKNGSEIGSGYLGEIQEYFGNNFDLEKFSFDEDFFSSIDGEAVLFLEGEGGFSPFEIAYRYDFGTAEITEAAVVSATTRVQNNFYSCQESDNDFLMAGNFFDEKRNYIDVFLSESDGTGQKMSPEIQFPFAKDFPLVYLTPEASKKTTDAIILAKSLGSATRFNIGTNAIEGTVRVYKNGILDSGAKYDKESGSFTPSGVVGSTDRIYATWNEENSSTLTSGGGAFSAAGGLLYKIDDTSEADVSISTRIPVNPEKKYSDFSSNSALFAALASNYTKKIGNSKISNTISASVENENTTNLFKVLGFDENAASTYYLIQNADEENSGVKDSDISGYAIPLNWSFPENPDPTSEKAETKKTISIPGVKGNLPSSSIFSIALKNTNPENSESQNINISFSFGDDDAVEIKNAMFDPKKSEWQTVSVNFSDENRAKLLASTEKVTVKIVSSDNKKSSGTILIGPYSLSGISFSTETNKATKISQIQTTDSSLSASDVSTLNTGKNKVQKFYWSIDEFSASALSSDENFDISASRFFNGSSFSNYEELNFYFSSEKDGFCELDSTLPNAEISETGFSITLDRPIDDDSEKKESAFETALFLEIKADFFSQYENAKYHKVSIDLKEKNVKIDGAKLPRTAYILKIKKSIEPVRITLKLNAATLKSSDEKQGFYKSGVFSIDELHFKNTKPYFVISDKAEYTYKKDGALFAFDDGKANPIFSDFNFSATATGSTTAYTSNEDNSYSAGSNGVLSTKIPYFEIALDTNFSYNSAAKNQKDAISYEGSQSVKSSKPAFGFLSLEDTYNFSKSDSNFEKKDSVKTDFSSFGIPLSISFDTKSKNANYNATQSENGELSLKFSRFNANFKASVEQSVKSKMFNETEYFSGYGQATKFLFDGGKEDAQKRKVLTNGKISFPLPFVKFTPALSLSLAETYKSANETTENFEVLKSLDFPFTAKNINFNVAWKSTASGTRATEKGGSYKNDFENLGKQLEKNPWAFYALPFYDLTGLELDSEIFSFEDENSIGDSIEKKLFYSGLYTFSAKRPFFGNKKDIYIPQTVQLDFGRAINKSATKSDEYNSKISFSYTALNMFGKTGLLPIFKFYNQDELNSSFSVQAKFPRDEVSEIKWIFSGYFSAVLLFTNSNTLRNAIDFSFQDEYNWSGKLTAIWKRPGKISLIGGIAKLFSKKFKAESENKKITRSDSLNFSTSSVSSENSKTATETSTTKKIGFGYNHSVEQEITKMFSLFATAALDYSCTLDKINNLNATLSIGGELKF